MTNTDLLKQKVFDSGLKLYFIANEVGISRYALQLKIENKREFKPTEIKKICELLNIVDLSEMNTIFFA